MVKKFWYDDGGGTLVEYALIILLIIILCVGAITAIGISVEQKFDPAEQALT